MGRGIWVAGFVAVGLLATAAGSAGATGRGNDFDAYDWTEVTEAAPSGRPRGPRGSRDREQLLRARGPVPESMGGAAERPVARRQHTVG